MLTILAEIDQLWVLFWFAFQGEDWKQAAAFATQIQGLQGQIKQALTPGEPA